MEGKAVLEVLRLVPCHSYLASRDLARRVAKATNTTAAGNVLAKIHSITATNNLQQSSKEVDSTIAHVVSIGFHKTLVHAWT